MSARERACGIVLAVGLVLGILGGIGLIVAGSAPESEARMWARVEGGCALVVVERGARPCQE